ncbi:hypothetical protein OS188_02560 [Xanthomarina sp. F1114]|nr:hypothetical protein [Xanthomarina sp. F1114]MCX7546829.1 hypothetical protein [Xanthomarina sp. F1114]
MSTIRVSKKGRLKIDLETEIKFETEAINKADVLTKVEILITSY